MCGLCGEVAFKNSVDARSLATSLSVLKPRGPDGSGMLLQERIGLGHQRLSILGLTPASNQPMVDSENGLALVFNGCIYNFRELRQELMDEHGYRFFSDGDTEVILKAYAAWGWRCVERLHGVFAFALWERDSGRVMLARDRLGIKPLYIAESANAIRFASTLPALLAAGGIDASIDPVGLHNYMSFHAVVPAPRTILRGVQKLPPATVLLIDPDGSTSRHRYWTLTVDGSEGDGIAEAEWTERVRDTFRRATERHMVSDVPVGVLLSGGIDSSLVVALLAESRKDVKTFSIGFDDVGDIAGDEFAYSDLVAREFKTDHLQIRIPSDQILDALPDVAVAMSEPMMSHDTVAFYLLSKEVSQHVNVVQSGQGADEIFGGYHWHSAMMQSNDAAADYARLYCDRDHDEMSEALSSEYVGPDHSGDFLRDYFASTDSDDAVDQALQIDSEIMLVDDPVKRVDNMTMAWGLEARVPFLDHEMVELVGRIPSKLKVRNGGKHILKEAARGVVPDAVIDRPKGYFPVPALKYIRGPYLDYARDVLTSRNARERGIFNAAYVDRLLSRPEQELTPKGHSKLWQVVVLEQWMQSHGL